jgi:hypothetical protein
LFWVDNGNTTGYAKGNGGRIRIDVVTDNGAAKHHPTNEVLASFEHLPNYVNGVDPLGNAGHFQLLHFPNPPTLEVDRLYHLVFTNIADDPAANYVGLDVFVAFNSAAQPALSTTEFGMLYNDDHTGWKNGSQFVERGKTYYMSPIVALNYADGTSQGNGNMEVWVAQPRDITGDKAVRERFTPTRNRQGLGGVAVRLKKKGDGGPLVIRLEAEDGSKLAEARVPAGLVNAEKHDWVTGQFDAAFTLTASQTYHLVLTSPEGSYEAFCIRDGAPFGFDKQTVFVDGYAQFDRDDGNGWQGWYGWSSEGAPHQRNGDLQFYFFSAQVGLPPSSTSGAFLPMLVFAP